MQITLMASYGFNTQIYMYRYDNTLYMGNTH